MTVDELFRELEEDGYHNPQIKDNGRLAALYHFTFTAAIIADIDKTGYKSRWCYRTMREAKQAFDVWDGEDAPIGWHRELIQGKPIRIFSKGRILTENQHHEFENEKGEVVIDY